MFDVVLLSFKFVVTEVGNGFWNTLITFLNLTKNGMVGCWTLKNYVGERILVFREKRLWAVVNRALKNEEINGMPKKSNKIFHPWLKLTLIYGNNSLLIFPFQIDFVIKTNVQHEFPFGMKNLDGLFSFQ